MIRVQARKSEIQAESQSYGPKVRVAAENPNRIAQKRDPNRFLVLLQQTPLYMGKMGSICHFPRALPASIWGHCSQILFLIAFGAHKKACDSDIFRAVFPCIWASEDPQTLQNKGKRKMTNRHCLHPPPACTPLKAFLNPPKKWPTLIFLSLLFWKRQGNHQKSKDFLSLPDQQNPWERREKH